MELRVTINGFTKPFAVMKIGIAGYGGEETLWRLPKGCRPTFCHIMVRICEEYRRTRSEGAYYYPFGLTTKTVSVLETLDRNHGEIDIFFVPVKSEAEDWDWGLPDPTMISWNRDAECYTRIIVDGKESRIPDPVRLWASESGDYPVLLVDNLVCFERTDSVTLDFAGAHCVNVSTGTPVQKSLVGSVAFGVFENRSRAQRCGKLELDAIARGRLVPPYCGIARP